MSISAADATRAPKLRQRGKRARCKQGAALLYMRSRRSSHRRSCSATSASRRRRRRRLEALAALLLVATGLHDARVGRSRLARDAPALGVRAEEVAFTALRGAVDAAVVVADPQLRQRVRRDALAHRRRRVDGRRRELGRGRRELGGGRRELGRGRRQLSGGRRELGGRRRRLLLLFAPSDAAFVVAGQALVAEQVGAALVVADADGAFGVAVLAAHGLAPVIGERVLRAAHRTSAAERAQLHRRSLRARTGVTVVSRAEAEERAEDVTAPAASPLRAAPRAAEAACEAQHAVSAAESAQAPRTCLRATTRDEHEKQRAEEGAHLSRDHGCCRPVGGARWNGEGMSSCQYRRSRTGPRCRSSHASNPENAAASHARAASQVPTPRMRAQPRPLRLGLGK